jgi:hypothetical protein
MSFIRQVSTENPANMAVVACIPDQKPGISLRNEALAKMAAYVLL